MSALWIRRPPERQESIASLLAAGIAAVGVGAVTFYLTRILLARDSLGGPEAPALPEEGSGGGSDAAGARMGGA